MKASCGYFSIAALLILSAGCATSRLSVKVDVYADDPLVGSLANPDRLAAIQSAIKKASPLASEVAETRKELMGQYEQLYHSYLRMLHAIDPNLGVDPEGATRGWAEPKRLYGAEIDKRASLVARRSEEALGVMSRFIPIAFSFRESKDSFCLSDFFETWNELRDAQCALLTAMENVTDEDLGTVFENIVDSVSKKIPDEVKKALATAPQAVQSEDFRKQIADFDSQLGKIDALARRITAKGDQAAALLAEGSRLIETAAESSDPGLIGKGITAAMNAARDVSAGPGPNLTPQAQAVIGQIASSYEFMTTQIDRLQDPADPAWRILSKPENQAKWQTYYAETRFYAEGKADVVFVRDRLGHFRLQRGKNNPAALIQGQFKITRAVASGLVDVLAAAAGAAGIPGVATGAPKIIPPSSTPPDQQGRQQDEASASRADISGDAKKQQRIQSSSRLRRELLRRLEDLQKGINSAPPGALSAELLESLRSTLRGFQELVESTRQEDS